MLLATSFLGITLALFSNLGLDTPAHVALSIAALLLVMRFVIPPTLSDEYSFLQMMATLDLALAFTCGGAVLLGGVALDMYWPVMISRSTFLH